MRRASIFATALLLASAGFASAETAKTETVGQFLLSLPASSVAPVVEYCSESVPEISDDLLREMAGFIEKLTEAGKPLMEELKNDPGFNEPVQESFRQRIETTHLYAMNIFKQQDPGITCRTALENIENATVGDLQKVVEETYQKFRGSAYDGEP